MEMIENSFQNGQESKEHHDINDSPMVNSTGRESEFYRNTLKDSNKYALSSNNFNHHCFTEQQEDNSIKGEFGSTSHRYETNHSPKFNDVRCSQGSSGNQRNSDPSQFTPNNRSKNLHVKFKNPEMEYEQTPVKKSSVLNDTRHLSSVQIEFSEEEKRASSEKFTSSAQKSQMSGINSMQVSQDYHQDGRPSFNTPQRTSHKLIKDGFDDILVTKTLNNIPIQSTIPPNSYGQKKMNLQSSNRKYLIDTGSEEKKSNALLDSENNINDGKDSVIPNSETKPLAKKQKKLIDELLGISNSLNSNKDVPQFSASRIIDEEDEPIQDSNPFILSPEHKPKVLNKNLLELNEEESKCSQSSVERYSSSRTSFSLFANDNLEVKEGWLMKRSFNNPIFIGWQRRY
jgi:hypothetical protein